MIIENVEDLINHINEKVEIICPICKKQYFIQIRKDRPHTYQTLICPSCRKKQTNIQKSGMSCNLSINVKNRVTNIWKTQGDEIRKKIKQHSLEKYGYESPNQCPEIIKKQQEGLIKHYGSLIEAYKQKYERNKKTKLEKYGDENYHNKEKASKTLQERHKIFENNNNCLRYTEVLKLYGQGWKSLNIPIIYDGRFRYISNEYIPKIKEYSQETHNVKCISNQEKELYQYIKTLTSCKIYKSVKNIIQDKNGKYDIDIYIPKLKIAIEYNGIYWHSTHVKTDKYYHQNKTKLCYSKGIQLIHIWENEWTNNKDQIKQQLKELLNGQDCSKYNWISVNDYSNYILSEPEEIKINRFTIFNEGKFIKKKI